MYQDDKEDNRTYKVVVNHEEQYSIWLADKENPLGKFKVFVKENNGKTQTIMAELWGKNITQQNISYTCQKLGITRKKRSDPASPSAVGTRGFFTCEALPEGSPQGNADRASGS